MCPIIRWSGRTASPSTCQPRTMVSQAAGSSKRPGPERLDHTGQLGGGGDVAADDPAGHQRTRRPRPRCPTGASMSRTPGQPGPGQSGLRADLTGGKCAADKRRAVGRSGAGSSSPRKSPGTSRQLGGRPAVVRLHVALGDLGEVGPALDRKSRSPLRADRAQQPAGQRARPGPRLEHPRRPGKMSARPRSGPRPSGRRPRRRASWPACSRRAAAAARRRLCRPRTSPRCRPRAPIRSSWLIDPRWVWNVRPACSTIWSWRPLGSVSCTWSPASNGPRGVEIMARQAIGRKPATSDAGEAPDPGHWRPARP